MHATSPFRSVARLLALAALALAAAPSRALAQVDLTQPGWLVTGLDAVSWNGSVLVFESQIPTAAGHDLSGYFDWYSNGNYRGRELFRGSLSSALSLDVQGYQLVNPSGIVLGRYRATVTPDGLLIVQGTWQAVTNGLNGVWGAARDPGFSAFCFGSAAACPCGNGGAPGRGCDNAHGTGGAELEVRSYAPSGAGGGSAELFVSSLPASTAPTVVLLRSATLAPAAAPFGDGLLCLGQGTPERIGARFASQGGTRFALAHSGGTGAFYYQALYRSGPASFCASTQAFNLSNAVAVLWP